MFISGSNIQLNYIMYKVSTCNDKYFYALTIDKKNMFLN